MDNHAKHMEREGSGAMLGAASYHVAGKRAGAGQGPANLSHVENNHSGAHDKRKAAGFGQSSKSGPVRKAMAVIGMHAGKKPNNK